MGKLLIISRTTVALHCPQESRLRFAFSPFYFPSYLSSRIDVMKSDRKAGKQWKSIFHFTVAQDMTAAFMNNGAPARLPRCSTLGPV